MPKQKYYVVWKGHKTGVFTTWQECSAQVTGFNGAEYKSFENYEAANAAFQSASFIGGMAPNKGFHSVIERPEPVNRVIPPNNTWIMIIPTPTKSQLATGERLIFLIPTKVKGEFHPAIE